MKKQLAPMYRYPIIDSFKIGETCGLMVSQAMLATCHRITIDGVETLIILN